MSLRTRLIIAFLCFSVVPLSAVTAFWYASSVSAFERAAEREAAQTAVEIGQRMESVTRAVGRRMDCPLRGHRRLTAVRVDPAAPLHDRVMPMLGDTAALVIESRSSRWKGWSRCRPAAKTRPHSRTTATASRERADGRRDACACPTASAATTADDRG